MGSATIDVTPYNGALLTFDLLSGMQTIVLGDFGSEESGVLTDTDGILGPSDDGVATFLGSPLTYIGSGTATPGVNVPGVGILPLGTTVDLVAFEAGGQIYFHFPSGDPNLLGSVALVTDLDTTPYPIFSPVCFAADTMISTPQGDIRAIDLRPGDEVQDIHGKAHQILWTSQRKIDLRNCDARARATLAPVVLPTNLFDDTLSKAELRLSRNHLILMRHAVLDYYFGLEEALVPAGAFVGLAAQADLTCDTITYVHFMCENHVIVRADGVAAETFYPGPQAMAALTPSQRSDWHHSVPRHIKKSRMKPACPVLTMQEARLAIAKSLPLAA